MALRMHLRHHGLRLIGSCVMGRIPLGRRSILLLRRWRRTAGANSRNHPCLLLLHVLVHVELFHLQIVVLLRQRLLQLPLLELHGKVAGLLLQLRLLLERRLMEPHHLSVRLLVEPHLLLHQLLLNLHLELKLLLLCLLLEDSLGLNHLLVDRPLARVKLSLEGPGVSHLLLLHRRRRRQVLRPLLRRRRQAGDAPDVHARTRAGESLHVEGEGGGGRGGLGCGRHVHVRGHHHCPSSGRRYVAGVGRRCRCSSRRVDRPGLPDNRRHECRARPGREGTALRRGAGRRRVNGGVGGAA
mmetsp:Transcript_10379/g.30853  ORF Transcript_10379/g.30853 Transcript_10379/m.30853 type:complete len:298 (-) Transcript_10379:6-899(-)